ncbi:ATPase [Sulfitobacter noctilucicola]|uniref:Capsular polysaccharide transport system ATP-binding protein n=1 Tax=Sulfitobacter noctilucicola TaxID=1342301 RepID=A0A7W6M5G2_9RHOB|nr:ABC transporter ATP-binding protein [Sulfitobacter noctilucicola]KIN62713.1 ATPase [Sulfitobacter noctilucicola]MBB4172754.1 capsular polysaccharide transport system ATP-binding protein [Sulfitobacter noctilucicola]
MIQFQNLTKVFRLKGQRNTVLDNVNMTFPTGRSVALLGRNGAGKSTLLKMIAGTMDPTSGKIVSTGTISWPVGFAGSFHLDLTGAQNTRFIARIYGVETDALVEFVQDFANLGKHFHQPLFSYSSGMKSRLAFGVSMGISFDTYLVDEVTSVGDAAFRDKSSELFNARMQNSGSIVVSHSPSMVRRLCDAAAVLEQGRITYYDDLEEGIEHHERNMKG